MLSPSSSSCWDSRKAVWNTPAKYSVKTEPRNTRSIFCTNNRKHGNIHLYLQVFSSLADKGELGEIWGREGSNVGTGHSNTSNRKLLQKGHQTIFVDLRKNKYSGLKASLEMKNWDTKCASSWHRQIVTKWLYYLKEHCTIGNKYAVCLYLYSKECCYLYIIGSTFVWVLFSSFPWNKSYPLTHNGIGRVPMHRLKCSFQIHQDSPLPAHFDLRCCDILPPSVLTSM